MATKKRLGAVSAAMIDAAHGVTAGPGCCGYRIGVKLRHPEFQATVTINAASEKEARKVASLIQASPDMLEALKLAAEYTSLEAMDSRIIKAVISRAEAK